MKKAKNLDQQLLDFEARANDELELLNDLGAAQFPTADLLDLKNRIDQKVAAHDFYHARIVWIGASSALWFVLGICFLLIGLSILGKICLFLMPFSIAAFLGGAFFLKSHFRSRGHWTSLKDEILDELLLRQTRQAEKKKG